MSLISEIPSLFHCSPQIHRQAWMDNSWEWHWNSRNQQFCTGIDPFSVTQACNVCWNVPALVLALWTVTGFYCSNCICYGTSLSFELGATPLDVKWMLLQHSENFLITSVSAYGKLNLMTNVMLQQNLKPLLLVAMCRGYRARFRPDFPWIWIHCSPSG